MSGLIRVLANIFLSLKGRSYWKKTSRNIHDVQDRVILIPKQNMEYSLIALESIEEYVSTYDLKRIIILVEEEELISAAKKINCDNCEAILCEEKIVQSLIYYNLVCSVDSRFIIASLERPKTRGTIENMIGCKLVTARQLIRVAIFHLPDTGC